jgi:hypothetical protein
MTRTTRQNRDEIARFHVARPEGTEFRYSLRHNGKVMISRKEGARWGGWRVAQSGAYHATPEYLQKRLEEYPGTITRTA